MNKPWSITRDGEFVTNVSGEFGMLRFFHTHHSFSAHHAVTFEGYKVLDENGAEVAV